MPGFQTGAPPRNERAVGHVRATVLLLLVLLAPDPAAAAASIDGAVMGWSYAAPFAGLLLTIALGPLLFPRLWHRHYGKMAAAWAVAAMGSLISMAGFSEALAALIHALLGEYLSFIILLFSLYTVAGGILISGALKPTPTTNVAILAAGTLIASFVGTTGAAMILVRPLIRANLLRRSNSHVLIFFIILVANVGGALSPLGDPPLFVGFLHGVDFFWTTRHLWPQTLIIAGSLLAIFAVLDNWRYRRDPPVSTDGSAEPVRMRGLVNLALIAAIVAVIVASAFWEPGLSFDVFGTRLELQNVARDAGLVGIAALSIWATPEEHRSANGFTWEPIREVAKLFAAIFSAIIPVVAMLKAGQQGAFAPLLSLVTDTHGAPREVAYFWLTGVLSAFLDNAPTYLLFFELAGGSAERLMGELSGTLAAISMGAVFMGALTYIGNAPNFMVATIAREQGIEMPSFFGYLASAAILLVPLFILLTILPTAPILSAR